MTARSLSARRPSRAKGWVLAGWQIGFAAWYAVCLLLVLSRAREFAGLWEVPSFPDPYTDMVDTWDGWALSGPASVTLNVAPMILGLSLIAGILTLLVGYATGRHRLRAALVTGLVVTLLTLILALTPAARSVSGWMAS
jgi:hypothetical protein